jgi:hypothetical protein
MPSSEEEAQALGHSEFWDARYKKADGDKPTHEWFRAFGELEPFFEKYLFQARGQEGKKGRILHLGSGDSVSFFFWSNTGKLWKWPICIMISYCSFLAELRSQ